jgi:cell filamentation protein
MSYSVTPLTDNCYEGTTCFINKPDIRDASKLRAVEGRITFAKSNDRIILTRSLFL